MGAEVDMQAVQMEDYSKQSQAPCLSKKRAVLLASVLAASLLCNLVQGVLLFRFSHGIGLPGLPIRGAVFAASHSVDGVDSPALSSSSPRMVRHSVSYKGSVRENTTVAGGVTHILDALKQRQYSIYSEVVADGTLGEYAAHSGNVGNRALQMRIVDAASGAQTVLVPLGLSLVPKATLIPNHYLFQHTATVCCHCHPT